MKNRLLWVGAVASLAAAAGCQRGSSSPFSNGPGTPSGGSPADDLPGLGSASAPTADGVVARIQNTLTGANPLAGNFAKAVAQSKPNLPQITHPIQATGLDQIPLLVYAACSDVKLSSYSVPTTGTIAGNSAALVAAGMAMLDAGLGGLASQGPSAAEFQATLQNLVDTLAADKAAAQTMTTSFIAVCMAATTAAVSMVGF